MKINQKILFELASVFAVSASLLFVGMQLYLDRQVALSEQYFNRAESRMETLRNQLASEDFIDSRVEDWERGIRPGWWNENMQVAKDVENNALSVRSLQIKIISTELSIVSLDNIYYQYNQGLIEEEIWQGLRNNLKNTLRNPSIRYYYLSSPLPITSLYEQLILEIDNE